MRLTDRGRLSTCKSPPLGRGARQEAQIRVSARLALLEGLTAGGGRRRGAPAGGQVGGGGTAVGAPPARLPAPDMCWVLGWRRAPSRSHPSATVHKAAPHGLMRPGAGATDTGSRQARVPVTLSGAVAPQGYAPRRSLNCPGQHPAERHALWLNSFFQPGNGSRAARGAPRLSSQDSGGSGRLALPCPRQLCGPAASALEGGPQHQPRKALPPPSPRLPLPRSPHAARSRTSSRCMGGAGWTGWPECGGSARGGWGSPAPASSAGAVPIN